MKASVEKSFHHGVQLHEEDLTQLAKYLSGKYRFLRFTAKCSDGVVLEANGVEQIISFENADFRRIRGLTIDASGLPVTQPKDEREKVVMPWDPERLSLRFGTSILGSVSIDIHSEDAERLTVILREIESRIYNAQPWFGAISRAWSQFPFILGGGLVAITVSVIAAKFVTRGLEWTKEQRSAFAIGLTFVVLGAMALIGRWLFPQLTFEIGRQKSKLARKHKIAQWVIVGIAGTVASYVALWDRFAK